MKRYVRSVLKIGGEMIVSFLLLSIFIFCIARIAPGDPLRAYYGDSLERMSSEQKEQAKEKLGLNESIFIQYRIWLLHAIKGDFGISFQYKQPVITVITNVVHNTLLLGGVSYSFIFLGACIIGVYCVQYEDSFFDRCVCKIGTVFSCIPSFWVALLLLLVCSVWLNILPASGAYTIGRERTVNDTIVHLILPSVVLIMEHLWYYAYVFRNRMMEETRKEYVIFALSKGISKRQVIWKHCLKAALPFYIHMMVVAIPHILGGTYIVETIFSYPGLGTLCFESAKYHDYNVLMVVTLITAGIVIVFHYVADVLCGLCDPTMRQQWKGEQKYES